MKKPKLTDMAEAALKRIELCKQRLVALEFAVGAAKQGYRYKTAAESGYQAVRLTLFEDLNDAYRNLFMWGVVLEDRYITKAKAEAFEHFLKEGISIMQYLDIDCKHPGMWLADEEKELRAEIKKLDDERKKKK